MYTLIIILLFTTPEGNFTEKLDISGFKSENSCRVEASTLRAKGVRSEKFSVIFDHCTRVR
jgi:hypothetical protein